MSLSIFVQLSTLCFVIKSYCRVVHLKKTFINAIFCNDPNIKSIIKKQLLILRHQMFARKTPRITKKILQKLFEITNARFLFKTNNDVLKIDTFYKILQVIL